MHILKGVLCIAANGKLIFTRTTLALSYLFFTVITANFCIFLYLLLSVMVLLCNFFSKFLIYVSFVLGIYQGKVPVGRCYKPNIAHSPST